jgi:hypothetical protein
MEPWIWIATAAYAEASFTWPARPASASGLANLIQATA